MKVKLIATVLMLFIIIVISAGCGFAMLSVKNVNSNESDIIEDERPKLKLLEIINENIAINVTKYIIQFI